MFDSLTWNLVQELSETREFTITEDHLKLLRRVYVAWDFGEGDGAPAINSKKPYGNSYVERDIAEILDVPDEDWIYENGHKAYVTPEAGGGRLANGRSRRVASQCPTGWRAGNVRGGTHRLPTRSEARSLSRRAGV